MIPAVFGKLKDSGFFFDPIARDIEINFMPNLLSKVKSKVNLKILRLQSLTTYSVTKQKLLDSCWTSLSAALSSNVLKPINNYPKLSPNLLKVQRPLHRSDSRNFNKPHCINWKPSSKPYQSCYRSSINKRV